MSGRGPDDRPRPRVRAGPGVLSVTSTADRFVLVAAIGPEAGPDAGLPGFTDAFPADAVTR
ncbi:hypothetical protein SUDANB132_02955 [Streptomyces sp. enrichment culture]